MDKEKETKRNMILIPEGWFTGLSEHVTRLEEAMVTEKENQIMMARASLLGYCKSANFILKHSEKISENNS